MARRAMIDARKTGRFSGTRKTGTVPAIIIRIPSCAALPDKSKLEAWGGARNRADRTSDALTPTQVELLLAAAEFAERIGLPLNRHIIIHWEEAGIEDSDAARATTAFLKSLHDGIRKTGGDSATIWVRENGDCKGSHVHILAHIPAGQLRMVKRLQCRWVSRATGKHYRREALYGRPVVGAKQAGPLYRANLETVIRYIAKGANADAASLIAPRKAEPGGTVIGKRCGTSQNIGRAAFSKIGKNSKVR